MRVGQVTTLGALGRATTSGEGSVAVIVTVAFAFIVTDASRRLTYSLSDFEKFRIRIGENLAEFV